MFEKKNILGVGFSIATLSEVLEYITKGLEKPGKKCFVVTPNPELLVLAHKDPQYKKVLNSFELSLPDGIGVVVAGKLLGKGLKEKITGVGLLNSLCKEVCNRPITVGFLGGGPGVAEKTAECLVKKYPELKVGFVGEEWGAQIQSSKFKVQNSNIDILFVAFGSPKQEVWISQNLGKLPVKVAIGVGGAFDFISGRVRRAPLWIQKIGLEWLFRLIIQPWRIKRQFALFEFVYLVLKEKLYNF